MDGKGSLEDAMDSLGGLMEIVMEQYAGTSPNWICPHCGGRLMWDSDDNASDVSGDYAEDDPAVISSYTCTRCGAHVELGPQQGRGPQLAGWKGGR